MDLLENNRIRCKEEVEQAVDKRHVDTQQKDNRFSDEQSERTTEVLGNEFPEVYLNLLLLGMYSPVLRSAAKLCSFLDKDHGRVCFF